MTDPDDIKDATTSRHAVVLVYGEPGSEKTRRIVGKLPGNNLIIKPPTDHIEAMDPSDRKRAKIWTLKDWDDVHRAEDYLRMEGSKWNWVAIDSLSLLQDHLLDDELDTEITEINRNPRRKLFGPDQGVYGRNMYKIGAFIRDIVGPDLFNIMITCHPSSEGLPSPDKDDEGDPILKLMPWIQGKNMSSKICGYTHMVALLAKDSKGKVFLRTSSNDSFYAKDQFHIAPTGILRDPDGAKLAELIDGRRGAADAKPARQRRRAVTRKGGK